MNALHVSAFLFYATVSVAAGAEAAQETLKATSGEEIRLAVLGSIKADCTVNPAPEVKITQPAAHGIVRIVEARLKTKRFPQCVGTEIPVKVVFYKSDSAFKGSDKTIVEISFKPGEASIWTFSVSVK